MDHLATDVQRVAGAKVEVVQGTVVQGQFRVGRPLRVAR